MVHYKNSTDLSSGRRPESKSDEFSDLTPLVIEIIHETAEIKCFPYSVDHSVRKQWQASARAQVMGFQWDGASVQSEIISW